MTKRLKTNLFIIAIIIASLLFTAETIYAADCIDWTALKASDGGNGGGDGNSSGGSGGASCPLGKHTSCNVNHTKTKEEIELQEDLYDQEGNYIGNALVLKDKYRFVAGRFVGIDAYEDYKKTFYVDISVECIYGWDETRYYVIHHSVTCWGEDEVPVDCSYDEYIPYQVRHCDPCSAPISICRPEADALLNSLAHSVDVRPDFVAKRQDVNDIAEGIIGEDPQITINTTHVSKDYGHSEPSDPNSSTVWQTVNFQYTYNLETAWIDPISGKVKYENSTVDPVTAKDKETFIKVPEMYTERKGEKIQVGQYFIPLNAKSTDLLRYNLYPNMSRSPLSASMCSTLIDKYSKKNSGEEYWADFILDVNGNPLYNTRKTTESAKKAGSCRTGLFVGFKISQQFYNETTNKNKTNLSGYNFFYRPIDYTEPFPNGIYDDSYWKNNYNPKTNAVTVANAAGNKQDLDKSFSEITYATNDGYDLNKIREYNARNDNLYTSWEKISPSGTSSFISENYGLTRYDCQTYYALGCGPANENWQECKSRKTEVCKK